MKEGRDSSGAAGGEPSAAAWALVIATNLFWGLGCFAMNSAQQARLVGIAPALASASIAPNSSVRYGGQAAGAALGAR